jgi:GAF domain-containing protein
MGVLFAGKDHGGIPDEEDVTVASGLAAVGARALEMARRFADARRGAAVAERLSESARLAERGDEMPAAALVARAAAEAVDADVALLRTSDDETGELVTRGVYARSASFAAELEGTRVAAAEVDDPVSRRIGDRLGADARMDTLPIEVDGSVAGYLLVGRAAAGAGAADVAIAARPAAAQAALLVLLSRARARRRGGAGLQDLGEALVAAGSEAGIGRLLARLVCEGLGAQRAVVYTGSSPDDIEPVAGHGFRREELATGPGRALARDALRRGEAIATGAPAGDVRALAAGGQAEEVLSLPLVHEERPVGVVQVFLGAARPDRPATLDVLLARAAEAIDRVRAQRRREEDGRRLAALVDIASKAGVAATASDTLAAVGAHVATLVSGTIAAVFALREGRVAMAEPVTALQSTYGAAVATLLRGDPLADAIVVADAQRDPRLTGIAKDLSTAGVRAILVVPLRFRDEPIGALALAAPEPGRFADDTAALLRRQAPPIALALGGALLAQSATLSEDELEAALSSERHARAELAAQETMARVAAEGWPRDRAVAAAARASLELLDVDATCLLVQAPGGGLAAEAFHVAAPSLREPVRRVLAHAATGASGDLVASLARGRSLRLPEDAPADGAALLGPLLGPGSTACLVPLTLNRKLVAALAAVSLDPERPVDPERVERAERFAPALALALRPGTQGSP